MIFLCFYNLHLGRFLGKMLKKAIKEKNIKEHFCEFYKMQNGVDLDENKEKLIDDIIAKIRGDKCAL